MPNLRKLSNELRVIAASTAEETAGDRVTEIEDRIYPGVYNTAPTNKPHSGDPSADGDRCVILVGGTPTEHLRSGGGWLIPNFDAQQLAQAETLPIMAFSATEAQRIFDNALPLQDYEVLRAYDGRARTVQVTGAYALAQPDGIAGPFRRVDGDTTSADNGGTIIVDALDRRWHRITDAVTFGHFGAVGNMIADDTIPIRNAVSYALTNVCDLHGVAGRTYRITGEINFPKKHSGVIREYITYDGHGCKIFIDGVGITGFGFTKTGSGMFDGSNYYLIFKNFNFTSVAGNGCIAIRPAGFITSQYIGLHFAEVDYPFWAEKDDVRLTPNYVQSPRIIECYSVHHKRFFTAPRVYDFVMDNTFIDAALDGILIDFGPAGQSVFGMRITNSAIQSQSGVGVAVGGATGMVIENNYWENNGREFVAIHSGTTVNYGGSIQNNFIQPKASPPPERVAAFDLGGCSSSGFKLGGNVAQDQKLYNFSSSALGYFNTTNDRSSMPVATLYHATIRPSTVRAIFNDGARWGLLWGTSGGMVLNPVSRGIEYTHPAYDYLDPTDNLRVPIVQGVAATYPDGYGSGLDGLGVPPGTLISAYTQKAWARGSYLANPTPAEAGAAGSKYVITGWICTASGRPGTWLPCRSLTGG